VHPDHWWQAFQKAAADAGGLDDVAAISVGGQQHGMVLLDSNGLPVREALLWNDTRSAKAAEDLIAELATHEQTGEQAWVNRVGLVPVASALLEGAEALVLEGVAHGGAFGPVWYGTPAVVERWWTAVASPAGGLASGAA
jgi:hypothetical protein